MPDWLGDVPGGDVEDLDAYARSRGAAVRARKAKRGTQLDLAGVASVPRREPSPDGRARLQEIARERTGAWSQREQRRSRWSRR